MIKHIVMWAFGDEAIDKLAVCNELKTAFDALPSKIESIRELEVGINVNPTEKFDLVLTTMFDSMEGLDVYQNHPDHKDVGAMFKKYSVTRACVDYNF